MKLQCESQNLNEYLQKSDVIDFDDKEIQLVAKKLSAQANNEIELAKVAFEFVRDRIAHSCDINGKVVTCEASSVLHEKQGLCYAKSHLLAAILRYLDIPTGFCYQLLVFNDSNPNYLTLHGLNAIYLSTLNRWIRVDARGNKPGVNAQFNLEREMLAYPVRVHFSEIDYPTIYSQPSSLVVSALKNSKTFDELIQNLPQNL